MQAKRERGEVTAAQGPYSSPWSGQGTKQPHHQLDFCMDDKHIVKSDNRLRNGQIQKPAISLNILEDSEYTRKCPIKQTPTQVTDLLPSGKN